MTDWLNTVADWFSVPGMSADQANLHPGDYLRSLAGKAGGEVGQAVEPFLPAAVRDVLPYVVKPSETEALNAAGVQPGTQPAAIKAITPEEEAADELRKQALVEKGAPKAAAKTVGTLAGEVAGDPTNLAALGISIAQPELAPLVSAGFTAQLGGNAIEEAQKGNWGSAALNAAMAAGTLGHSLKGAAGAKAGAAERLAVSDAASAANTGLQSTFTPPSEVSFGGLTPEPIGDSVKGWKPFKNNKYINTVENPKAGGDANFKSPSGKNFTIDTMGADPEAVTAARNAARNPAINSELGDLVDWSNDVIKFAKQDGLYDNIEIATKVRDPLADILGPEALPDAEVRGVSYGRAGNYGHTYFEGKNVSNGKRPVWINARNNALVVKGNIDWLADAQVADPLWEKAVAELPPDAQEYFRGVRNGEARIPEVENKVAADMFAKRVLYTALHEGHAHWGLGTGHLPGAPTYRTGISDLSASRVFESEPKQISLYPQNVEPGRMGLTPVEAEGFQRQNMSDFEPANNAIVTALRDDTRMQVLKQQMMDPEFTNRAMGWYRAALGDGQGVSEVKLKKGRIVGRPEAKAAQAEFAADEAPSTPLEEAPQEPFGPQLAPLAERIKMALDSQEKINSQNAQMKTTINRVRAEALRQNADNFSSRTISPEEFAAKRKEIMSGSYGLQNVVDGMAITPEEKVSIMDAINQESKYEEFERARAQEAFDKLLSGERLQDNEIISLKKALVNRVTDLKADPMIMRMGQFFENATGSTRALMTSWDLSAAGRQALFGSVMNPVEAARAFKAQIQALKMTHSEFESFMGRLRDPLYNPYAEMAEKAGLHFSETMDKANTATMEEAFYQGKWAEKVPGVRRTEQAYIAYLNKLRVELFNKSMESLKASNTPLVDAEGFPSQEVKDVAYMVNTLTGRGEMSLVHVSKNAPLVKGLAKAGLDLGIKDSWNPGEASMKNMHRALTSVFFAPRFAAAQASLLRDASMALVGGNLSPRVYAMYMKNVMGTTLVMSSIAASLVQMGVGTFQYDPRKKDFGVLKVGNTRYDLFGGLRSWAKVAAQTQSDVYWSGRSRAPKKFGDRFNKTHTEVLGKFVQGKLSPMASLITEAITGEDYLGKKSTAWNKAYSHLTPMIAQTAIEAIQANEADQLAVAVPLAALGFGVNSYDERELAKRNRQ